MALKLIMIESLRFGFLAWFAGLKAQPTVTIKLEWWVTLYLHSLREFNKTNPPYALL